MIVALALLIAAGMWSVLVWVVYTGTSPEVHGAAGGLLFVGALLSFGFGVFKEILDK